jgi:hypothetical protein
MLYFLVEFNWLLVLLFYTKNRSSSFLRNVHELLPHLNCVIAPDKILCIKFDNYLLQIRTYCNRYKHLIANVITIYILAMISEIYLSYILFKIYEVKLWFF